jgi:hypothetical protein
MNVEVENLEKINQGWTILLRVEMDEIEHSKLDRNSLGKIEDFQVDLKKDKLYFQCYMENSEPWEDIPLEELLKALKLEVEYKVNQVLSLN